ncbi:MAG TPA: hypothetical protein VLX92_34975 [Kofleriaceae bacterium]|nr:hypothetical protein [Kofleriaceae bacterium]
MAASGKGYKRSWKNLLLNKRYQLRFTIFMVAIAAVLMTGLGYFVMKKANEATNVAKTAVEGRACPQIPVLTDNGDDDSGAVQMQLDEPSGSAAPAPAPAAEHHVPSSVDPKDVAKHNAQQDLVVVASQWCDAPASCAPETAQPLLIKAPHCNAYVKQKLADPVAVDALRAATISIVRCDGEGGQTVTVPDALEPPHHAVVQIEESTMTLTPAPPPRVPADYGNRVVAHWTCELEIDGKTDDIERGRKHILLVLIATGIALMLGLALYGIKMTHKVAGPLFKVSLYLAKMRDGRFDKVYNLRKGDQLVDFYEHFKAAHAGVVRLERDDIEQIKAVIAAARQAGAGDHEAVAELEKLLDRKEKSLE